MQLDDLGDAGRVVTHALDLRDHHQHGDDEAEVAGDRLLGRDQVDRAVLDLEPNAVDLLVVRDDHAGETLIDRLQ